jgi:GT2 family glycosyltransferase
MRRTHRACKTSSSPKLARADGFLALAEKPFLSVLIPTKDRAPALAHTLDSLSEQEGFEGGFEIVVADNGSSDDTPAVLRRASEKLPSLTAVTEPEGGPASARNAAAASARGEVLLLLGDDTAPAAANLLARHAALHRDNPAAEFACLGKIEWSPQATVTDFMRWLDQGGPQFHYWEIGPGAVDTTSYFYSSHLSLKREALAGVGGFDRRFPFAAVEDTDLGIRLADRGVTLEYHPELLVWHDHPTTVEASLRRMVRVGRSAALYNSLHGDRPHPRIKGPSRTRGLAAAAAAPALRAAARISIPSPWRERIWSLAHRCQFAVGYQLGPPVQP